MKELIIIPYAKKMTINTGKRGQGEERERERGRERERERQIDVKKDDKVYI